VIAEREPADPATVAEITVVVRELLTYQNRVKNGRFFALFADPMLRQFAQFLAETPENIANVLAPFRSISVQEQARLLAVTDISVVADGPVAVLVVSDDPALQTEGSHTLLVVFFEEEGRWSVAAVARFTALELIMEVEEGANVLARRRRR
jgi:hypothetical protein